MRVRNRKGATELLEANPQYVVLNPEDAKGKWHEIFGNDHPIHIEVGSGKGACGQHRRSYVKADVAEGEEV